ncbi:MAG: hypothetical protein IJA11_08670 [Oscillospiraceae bacterium]|nr:hypothetical protein [Oscillospiraceae bacterium]
MAEIKKLVFNPDAAEEYFSMLLTSYQDTGNDIFRRDNEGRHASEQHYSAEYQKYIGMQIAMREVLKYFGKYDLGGWISAKDQTPKEWRKPNGDMINYLIFAPEFGVDIGNYAEPAKTWVCVGIPCNVTHWKQLPDGPRDEENGTE